MRYRLRTLLIWELLSAIGLALSMFAGVVLTIVSLLIRPSFAEYSAIRLLLGALAGAAIWKAGQWCWRRRARSA